MNCEIQDLWYLKTFEKLMEFKTPEFTPRILEFRILESDMGSRISEFQIPEKDSRTSWIFWLPELLDSINPKFLQSIQECMGFPNYKNHAVHSVIPGFWNLGSPGVHFGIPGLSDFLNLKIQKSRSSSRNREIPEFLESIQEIRVSRMMESLLFILRFTILGFHISYFLVHSRLECCWETGISELLESILKFRESVISDIPESLSVFTLPWS